MIKKELFVSISAWLLEDIVVNDENFKWDSNNNIMISIRIFTYLIQLAVIIFIIHPIDKVNMNDKRIEINEHPHDLIVSLAVCPLRL